MKSLKLFLFTAAAVSVSACLHQAGDDNAEGATSIVGGLGSFFDEVTGLSGTYSREQFDKVIFVETGFAVPLKGSHLKIAGASLVAKCTPDMYSKQTQALSKAHPELQAVSSHACDEFKGECQATDFVDNSGNVPFLVYYVNRGSQQQCGMATNPITDPDHAASANAVMESLRFSKKSVI